LGKAYRVAVITVAASNHAYPEPASQSDPFADEDLLAPSHAAAFAVTAPTVTCCGAQHGVRRPNQVLLENPRDSSLRGRAR